jgi:dTDP-D-glucose 4,6-dehydratase
MGAQTLFSVKLFMQVVVLDKLDYCATLNNLKSVQGLKNFRFVKGDIQCIDLVSHVLEKEDVDTIMHFAAQVRLLSKADFLWVGNHPYFLSHNARCTCSIPLTSRHDQRGHSFETSCVNAHTISGI